MMSNVMTVSYLRGHQAGELGTRAAGQHLEARAEQRLHAVDQAEAGQVAARQHLHAAAGSDET